MQKVNNKFIESTQRCLENGQRLLDEAELLEFEEPQATMYFLSMIAQEECAKGFLLFLVSMGVIPWHSLIFRAARDHRCKQLLCVVMDFLTDDNEFFTRMNSFVLENKRLDIPSRVTDSIFILRYEKIGRWESDSWVWAENPHYEDTARLIAEGKQDLIKQRSLYVELGRTGTIKATPKEIAKEQAYAEYERGRRFTSFLKDLVNESRPIGTDYTRIEEYFRTLFSSNEAKA